MSAPRYICIHGHFYQPPRENPWLEAIEVQDSAAPYHDWNERITRECYAPNGRSRLVDGQGKIVGLVNNYAWMSFNFGPTLLSWMAEFAPDGLRRIVEGDRVSQPRHRGHGNALAQVYNHVIMPLASERDKKTQVRWGIADFRHRFGRDPEGMWLAETAADMPSLETLAEAGIRFTILAPRQARRWRRLGEPGWVERSGGVDPSRAYLCRLPSGRNINLFFYDGSIAQQVAFERLLDSGEKFLGRLMQGFDKSRSHAQLMHIATDGESYGHHHAFGDMALACALDRLSRDPDIRLTNYGEFLELHPPEWEVEIHDKTSWSCAHGVERWRNDCGCKTRGDWHQQWRGPLRDAFDGLKERVDALYATRGRACFSDPWAARDAYIDVVLDRSPDSVRAFFQKHGHADGGTADLAGTGGPGGDDLVREGLWLLEMQRQALLMYTSCGWFFDEISGLETTQCLRYAARAIQLAKHAGEDFEDEFVRALEKAPSNLPELGHGRGVWEQLVQPWRVNLDRVLAHHAISLLYHRPPLTPAPVPQPGGEGRGEGRPRTQVYCYNVEALDQEVHQRGSNHLAIGRLHVRSQVTWNEAEASFVVLHFGGLDFHAVLRRKGFSAVDYQALKRRLLETYHQGSLADVTAQLAREFEGSVYRLEDLFSEERRRIIGIVLQDRFEQYRLTFDRLVKEDEDMLNRLGRLHYPFPRPLRAAAAVYLDGHLEKEIRALETDGSLDRIRSLYERGRSWGYRPERELLGRALADSLRRLLHGICPDSDLPALEARVSHLLAAAELLGIPLDLWLPQNQLLDVCAAVDRQERHRAALAQLAKSLNISQGLLGWQP